MFVFLAKHIANFQFKKKQNTEHGYEENICSLRALSPAAYFEVLQHPSHAQPWMHHGAHTDILRGTFSSGDLCLGQNPIRGIPAAARTQLQPQICQDTSAVLPTYSQPQTFGCLAPT